MSLLICLLLFSARFTLGLEEFRHVSLKGCAQSKGCFRPKICPDSDCSFLATWRVVDEEYTEIELIGQLNSGHGFVTVAFSDDRRPTDDAVVGCYVQPNSGLVHIRAATVDNDGRSSFYDSPDKNFLLTSDHGLGGHFNRHLRTLQCRFRRRIIPKFLPRQFKDLTPPKDYYIIVSVRSDLSIGGYGKPALGMPVVSNTKAVITSPAYGSMTGEQFESSSIMKAHGCLMVIAWVLCASIGVIMSRYYKDMWPNSVMLKEPVWQQNHRILQACCVTLTCIGIILAFIYCEGYSKASTYPYYIHPILGLIVFVLAFINPLLSLCRCKDRSPHRPWYNWIHFFVGTIAHCLSIPTMMLGLRMPAAGTQLPFLNYPLWILIFFVIFQFCVEITLELHGCIYYRRNRGIVFITFFVPHDQLYTDKRYTYERDLATYLHNEKQGYPTPAPKRPEPSGRMFKYFVIGLHSTICAIVAVLLVIIIIVN